MIVDYLAPCTSNSNNYNSREHVLQPLDEGEPKLPTEEVKHYPIVQKGSILELFQQVGYMDLVANIYRERVSRQYTERGGDTRRKQTDF